MTGSRDDLQFLAMFHFAVGAMAALVALVPPLYLYVAVSLAEPGQPIASPLVDLFGERGAAVAAGILLVLGMALGGLLIAAGAGLLRCRRFRLCFTASITGAFFIPFGTLLAAVTLPLLSQPKTRDLFSS